MNESRQIAEISGEENADREKTLNKSIMEEAKHLMDVPVQITIQLAICNMKIRDILKLKESSIVELPKSAGENVDILANQKPLGCGEVLELEGSAGVRITGFSRVP